MEHVPGTVLLDDRSAHAEDVAGGLKHGTGRNAHIVLSPQPSGDPNDPLNWYVLEGFDGVFYSHSQPGHYGRKKSSSPSSASVPCSTPERTDRF